METAYSALGLAVLALSLVTALAGARDLATGTPSRLFWFLLRFAQVVTGLFALFAAVLYLAGNRADDGLHYVYALLPVIASFLAELIRGSVAPHELGTRLDPDGDQPLTGPEISRRFARLEPAEQEWLAAIVVRRETTVMIMACLVNTFLVWRALVTVAGLF